MFQTAYSFLSWLLNGGNQKDGFLPAAFLFLVAMLGLSLWYPFLKARKPMAPLPPGPLGLPIVGYLPFLGFDNLHLVFTELAGVYGPIYKLWLGNKLIVVISSPSLVKEVVRDHDIAFSEREPPIAAQIITFGTNDIAFDSYSSPSWKHKRKILASDMLSSANLNACYDLRREKVMEMVGDVYENVGKLIDVGELAFRTLTSLIGNMVWGGEIQGEQRTIVESQFKKIFAEIMVFLGKPNISDIFPSIAWFDIQGIERGMKKIRQSFNEFLDSVIEERMKKETGEQKSDVLQMLLDLHKNQDSPSSLTMNQIKGILVNIVVAGTDTTSGSTEWAMSELMQHPEIMEKVKKELNDVIGVNNTVEEFHLPNLRYLNAVIKETFRLHPVLPLLVPRCSARSLTVGGYTIPKGSRVFLNTWSIHRDLNIWDNPMEFQPERFLNEPGKLDFRGNDFRYLPFGSGRRKCPGINLGEKMLSFILASLLHSFEWKLPQDEKVDLSGKFGIIMGKKNPLHLIPTPRLTNLELYKRKS
ncbi:labd-13Z-ene-9,15,16-triol synthase, chloroplastic [Gossypium raimondii]|uniref:Cytochrome P450 n=1 Tax=Gossypium raimondii TaxID=29730 RepID=A0A0D2QLX1_GOSRA|nr:labd-13Z-ene-9,15,16-triol synthase, chloroplastic [Gossypium raimondii]KJB20799.1 hypothetical protein B456_003G165600 [Gossypium raimondii]